MGRNIRAGMRVRMKTGPAAGIIGTVVDDFNGRIVEWDAATIAVPQGLRTKESESALERIQEE